MYAFKDGAVVNGFMGRKEDAVQEFVDNPRPTEQDAIIDNCLQKAQKIFV